MKKKLLGWLAMATMLVGTGCSSDEVVNDYSPENAIQFGTYTGRDAQGRGTELNNTSLENFGVFASYTKENDWNANVPNFMYNQYVEKSVNSWTYSPVKYWPTNKKDKISFFAYAPHVSNNTVGISVKSDKNYAGAPIITYTINANDLENQEDFVADVQMNSEREGTGTSLDNANRDVKFTFNHELTRLNICAKLDRVAWNDDAASNNKTKVNITSIKLKGEKFYTEADYTFAKVNDENTTIKRGVWTGHRGTQLFDIEKLLDKKTPVVNSLGDYNTPGILLTNGNEVDLFKTGQYMFMIPPTQSDGTTGLKDGDVIQMEVAYDIVTKDISLAGNHSVSSATKVIDFPAYSMKQGVAYNFCLIFGLNEIVLTASVADWTYDDKLENVDWPKEDAH